MSLTMTSKGFENSNICCVQNTRVTSISYRKITKLEVIFVTTKRAEGAWVMGTWTTYKESAAGYCFTCMCDSFSSLVLKLEFSPSQVFLEQLQNNANCHILLWKITDVSNISVWAVMFVLPIQIKEAKANIYQEMKSCKNNGSRYAT